jgi:hypothetical protein
MLKGKKFTIVGIIALVLAVGIVGVKAADNGKINDLIELAKVVNESNSDVIMSAIDFLSENSMLGASGTRFPNGISADSTSPSAGEVRGTTLTITEAVTIGGISTLGGGVLATSTSASAGTLTEADLLAYNYFKVTANTPGGFALTLPATSTMTTLIPNAGDYVDIYIENATSSTQALTITAGAGIRLVASTNAMDIIDETEVSWIRLIRENDTDVIGLMSDELVDAD